MFHVRVSQLEAGFVSENLVVTEDVNLTCSNNQGLKNRCVLKTRAHV